MFTPAMVDRMINDHNILTVRRTSVGGYCYYYSSTYDTYRKPRRVFPKIYHNIRRYNISIIISCISFGITISRFIPHPSALTTIYNYSIVKNRYRKTSWYSRYMQYLYIILLYERTKRKSCRVSYTYIIVWYILESPATMNLFSVRVMMHVAIT